MDTVLPYIKTRIYDQSGVKPEMHRVIDMLAENKLLEHDREAGIFKVNETLCVHKCRLCVRI